MHMHKTIEARAASSVEAAHRTKGWKLGYHTAETGLLALVKFADGRGVEEDRWERNLDLNNQRMRIDLLWY